MRTGLLILALARVSNSLAAEHPPEQRLRYYLAEKAERGSVFAQGRLDGIDYRKLLRGAIAKDAASLSGIFRYTANGKLMGEGADSNCDILRELLRFWGDLAYARTLAVEPPRVRAAVIASLDDSWPFPGWQLHEFPVTYRLSKHESRYRP